MRRLLPLLCLLVGCGDGALDAIGFDLVAHWTFDEGMGTLVRDSSPSHRTGTINGSTWSWLDQGRFGRALHFEQGDYVAVDNFPNASRDWTVSAWVQVANASADLGEVTLISTENLFTGGWEMTLYPMEKQPQLLYHFGFWEGPGPTEYAHCECPNCIQLNRWQHLAAVVDGSADTLTFYLDGVLQARATVGSVISPGMPTLYMGRWANPGRLFAGSLDDISIWRRALTSDEVASLTRAPSPQY